MSSQNVSYSLFPAARPWYQPHSVESRRIPSEKDIAESYLTQWYRITQDGVHFALRPYGLEHNELWPALEEVPSAISRLTGRYIVTWAHSERTASTAEGRAFRLERLLALCREKNLDTSEIGLLADRSQWVEPALVVESSVHDARDLVAVHKQPMLGQFVDGGVLWWSVEKDSSVSFAPLYVWSGTDGPCPMSRGPETNAPVKRDGGPGTSRGHAVAAMWADHSAWAHQFMRCQLHTNLNGKQQEKGRGIALSEISPASRRGPMRFIQHVDTSE